jgi:uridine kinase
MYNSESIKDILLLHHDRYPGMQIADMVKLIYQNEFAGGHLITDEDKCLKGLKEELGALESRPCIYTPPIPFEDIGNRLCRLNLAARQNSDIDIETLNRFFISTSNSVKGSMQCFKQKLEVFKQCCIEGSLPYEPDKVGAWLDEYLKRGCPPVHHSGEYKELYYPAYRVIKIDYMNYLEVFRNIDSLMKSHDRILVAIDGSCGSGKSTLAALIGDVYDCNIFHMDHFYLRPEQRTRERMEEAGGNVDYERFREEVIDGILRGSEFKYRIYDCKEGEMGNSITVQPKQLNIIEGAYSMHPALIGYYDLKVFLGIDEKEQRDRILERNGEAILEQFLTKWIPLENRYFEQLKIEEKCDLVYRDKTLI